MIRERASVLRYTYIVCLLKYRAGKLIVRDRAGVVRPGALRVG